MGRKGWGWEKLVVWVLPTPGQKEDGGVGTAVAGGSGGWWLYGNQDKLH